VVVLLLLADCGCDGPDERRWSVSYMHRLLLEDIRQRHGGIHHSSAGARATRGPIRSIVDASNRIHAACISMHGRVSCWDGGGGAMSSCLFNNSRKKKPRAEEERGAMSNTHTHVCRVGARQGSLKTKKGGASTGQTMLSIDRFGHASIEWARFSSIFTKAHHALFQSHPTGHHTHIAAAGGDRSIGRAAAVVVLKPGRTSGPSPHAAPRVSKTRRHCQQEQQQQQQQAAA
jgi:hypothetical protein